MGAWWLGFVICAGCSLVWALPMLLFPPKIPVKDEDPAAVRRREMEEGQSVIDKAKGRVLTVNEQSHYVSRSYLSYFHT